MYDMWLGEMQDSGDEYSEKKLRKRAETAGYSPASIYWAWIRYASGSVTRSRFHFSALLIAAKRRVKILELPSQRNKLAADASSGRYLCFGGDLELASSLAFYHTYLKTKQPR